MDKEDKNQLDQPTMPLRSNGHEVEVVKMPDDAQPKLGFRYGAKDTDVDVRAQSTLQWQGNHHSPRHQNNQATPVDIELNLRIRTTLSYEVPEAVRNEVNGMHTEPINEGRRSEDKPARERISVKIGF